MTSRRCCCWLTLRNRSAKRVLTWKRSKKKQITNGKVSSQTTTKYHHCLSWFTFSHRLGGGKMGGKFVFYLIFAYYYATSTGDGANEVLENWLEFFPGKFRRLREFRDTVETRVNKLMSGFKVQVLWLFYEANFTSSINCLYSDYTSSQLDLDQKCSDLAQFDMDVPWPS